MADLNERDTKLVQYLSEAYGKERELKQHLRENAKTEYFNEHEEIATYLAIETLAERVGDRDTAKLARKRPAAKKKKK
jgi:ferritin-like metal-binding protein YciE